MTVPTSVLDAYGFRGHSVEPVSGGLINATYSVKDSEGVTVAALQCLHAIFAAEVNIDIDVVTEFVAAQGLVTPRLVRARQDEVCVQFQGKVWRALSWVHGTCYSRIPDARTAEEGAALVGRFHRVLQKLDYQFAFTRSGVHDTQAHLERLRQAEGPESDALTVQALELRNIILEQVEALPSLPELPLRICHGDLKISNLLFATNGEGLCLVDLDTMGMQSIAYELGDALRSWGNRSGEDTPEPEIDSAIVAAVARGYALGSQGLLSQAEINSVILGLETICLELAARFCLDAFNDCYFGWDAKRYPNRRAHNIARAYGQLALSRSVTARRCELQDTWASAFIAPAAMG